ncbi:protein of unknown function [Paraburkholderia dioscoreae]|uniref:Uncharacterized protein n=1 Tax=Paraburkholderia dioscoreae TaxID=2604047 RepID=A0A5Q4ZBN7_9BURK|nr:protein of unknown function [Paraburkholderia dioscoreae]
MDMARSREMLRSMERILWLIAVFDNWSNS